MTRNYLISKLFTPRYRIQLPADKTTDGWLNNRRLTSRPIDQHERRAAGVRIGSPEHQPLCADLSATAAGSGRCCGYAERYTRYVVFNRAVRMSIRCVVLNDNAAVVNLVLPFRIGCESPESTSQRAHVRDTLE